MYKPQPNDYFKIVAVIRKKRVEYSYVPHKWEKDNILSWPLANLSALRSDPTTQPDTDWKKYPCKVKKTYIYGLDEAELWEEQFVDAGTDAEGLTLEECRKKKLPQQEHNTLTSYDKEFDAIGGTSSPENPENIVIINPDQWMYPDDVESGPSTSTTTQLELQMKEIFANQKKIIDMQERISERLDSEFTQQKATYDKIYRMLRDFQIGGKSDITQSQAKQKEHLCNKFKLPIASVEEMFAFNKEIGANSEYRKYLLETYTSLGGTEGNEDGKIIAKKLKAIFFTEHVLTLFSWTGVSRTPGMTKKESFQLCDNIIQLFLEILNLADNRWSALKNEKFFKYHTLKHAKQSEEASKKRTLKKKEAHATPISEGTSDPPEGASTPKVPTCEGTDHQVVEEEFVE